MALGATSTTLKIYNAFLSNDKSKMFLHGHSYTGNPFACVAAKASLEILKRDDTWKSIKRISSANDNFVNTIINHPQVSNARSLGVIVALSVKSKSEQSYFNYLRDKLYKFFISRKILLRPLGNVIYVMPPYCITNEELNIVYDAISELLNQLNFKL